MSVTEVLSMVMANREVRVRLLFCPSIPQFRGGQSGDVPGHNLSGGQGQTWGQDKVLCWRIQPPAITPCLQLSAISISQAMGCSRWELGTSARIPAPKAAGRW